MKNPARFCWPTSPAALEENIVLCRNARFAVLTDRLIRMEYAENNCFEDRASQSVFFRNFPVVNFSVSRENGIVTIETDGIVVTYREGETFSGDSLSFKLKNEPAATWHYGEGFAMLIQREQQI